MNHEDVSRMFHTESDKLKGLISNATVTDLPVSEIVEIYYQVINVSSMALMLRQQLDPVKHKQLLDRITHAESVISERFNSDIHPRIQANLADLITESTKNLQSQDTGNDTDMSAAYENLRQMMSTREFVGQYEKGLSG